MSAFGGAAQAQGAPANITLTPLERPAFAHLFSLADPQKTGIVTGQAAVAFFAASKLPPATLGQIWAMADSANNGFLAPQHFSVALRLIGHAQRGAELTDKLIQQPGPPPQFEGITLPTPVAGAGTPQRQASVSAAPVAGTITAADRARYTRIFAGAGPQNGLLDGEKAKEIFVKSKLPFDKLGAIWNLADTRARGALDLTDFIIGMHFIQGTMNGSIATIPTVLPLGLYEEASGGSSLPFAAAPAPMVAQTTGGSIPRQLTGSGFATPASPLRSGIPGQSVPSYLSPQRTGVASPGPVSAQPLAAQHTAGGSGAATGAGWAVSAAEKAKSDRFFDGLDTEKKGVLEGQAAVPFFMQSGLGEAVLAHVWDLSDITQSGSLSRDEFAVAMHLINTKLSGAELPNELSPDLIPPSLRGQKLPEAVNPQESDTQKDLFSLMDDDPAPLPVSSASAFVTPAATGSRAAPAPPAPKAAPAASPFDDDFFNDGFSGAPSAPALTADRSVTSPKPAAASVSTPGVVPNDASAELGNKQLQLDSTTKSLERLQGQKKDLETSVATGASSVAELESRLSSIKVTHEAEERLVRALEERQRAQAAELKTLREETIRGESELSALKAEKDELEQALLRDKEESREMKKKLAQVQTATQQLKDELEKLRKDARQQKGLAAIGKKQLATAEAEQDKVRAEIDNVHNEEPAEAPAPASIAVPAAATPSLASPAAAGVTSPAASVRSLNPFDRFTAQPQQQQQQSPGISSAALAGGAALGAGAATAAVAAEHLGSSKSPEPSSAAPPAAAASSTAFDDAFDAPLEHAEVAQASTTALPATDKDDVFDNDFGADAAPAGAPAAASGSADNAAFDEAFSSLDDQPAAAAATAVGDDQSAVPATVNTEASKETVAAEATSKESSAVDETPAAATSADAQEDHDSSDEDDDGPEDLDNVTKRQGGTGAIPGAFGGSDAGDFEAEQPSSSSRFPALNDDETTADTAAPRTVEESFDSAAPASSVAKSRDYGGPPLSIQNTGTSAGGDAFVDAQNGEAVAATSGGPAGLTSAEGASTEQPSLGHERFTTAFEPSGGAASPETVTAPITTPMAETSSYSAAAPRATSPNKSRRAPPPAPTRATGNTASSPASTTAPLAAAAGAVGAGAAAAATTSASSQPAREASFDDFDSAFEDLGPAIGPATAAPATGASSTSGFASATSSTGGGGGGGTLGSSSSTAFDDAFDGFDFVPSFNNGAPAPASGAGAGVGASGSAGRSSATNGGSASNGFDDFDAAFAPLAASSGAAASPGAPAVAAATNSGTSDGFSFDDAFVTPSGSANVPGSSGGGGFPTSSTPASAAPPSLPQRSATNQAQQQPPAAPSGALPDDAAPVRQLCAMGFPREKVIEALEKSNYRTERALEKLISSA